QAREKGVRVVSIGFGDEAGSKIQITDPQTGDKEYVTDRDGQPVISRLDGETLREIAVQTEGAYVPAGVGQLDLKAIYDEHIERMLTGTTEQQTRIVKQEAYHFFVLAAILAWLTAQVLNVPWAVSRTLRTGAAAVLAISCCMQAPLTLLAADTEIPPNKNAREDEATDRNTPRAVQQPKSEDQAGDLATSDGADDTEDESVLKSVLTARERYNLAITALSRGEERAEEMLEDVRSDAGIDGELRFRSTYNLGCFSAAKAQELAAEQPEDALKYMQQALNRFREAVRLRPDSDLARQNLELASREVLVLQDRLSQQESGTIKQRLDDLILQMRDHEKELIGAVNGFDSSVSVDQRTRSAFRRLGTTQREVIASTDQLLESIAIESTSPNNSGGQTNPASSGNDDDSKLRKEQLIRSAEYLQLSANWLQKARSMTRRILPQPAFLRWSAAIGEARRARDQLRPPTEILGALVKDTSRLAQLSEVASRPVHPEWLTSEYLYDEQNRDAERTKQLQELFDSVAKQLAADPGPPGQDSAATAPMPTSDPQQSAKQKFAMAAYSKAAANLAEAEAAMRTASGHLQNDKVVEALQSQQQALKELTSAAEYFLPLKQLIDVTARQQTVIANLHTQPGLISAGEEILQLQQANLRRASRLGVLLQQEAESLPPPAQDPSAQQNGSGLASSKTDESVQQRERIQYAQTLLAQAAFAMQEVARRAEIENRRAINQPAGLQVAHSADLPSPRPLELPPSSAGASSIPAELQSGNPLTPHNVAADRLAELQRLFFTVLEHLKDTAREQAELNEDTQTIAAKLATQDQSAEAFSPQRNELALEQSQLQTITDAIARALADQADAATAPAPQPPTGSGAPANNTTADSAGPSAEDLS
ncbi:MAG TPA: hypothetical protein DDW52_02340, partial [Planctomycetaceae bacterium]|nr:hypothetical protein [Planctomycetaceae bacterium]